MSVRSDPTPEIEERYTLELVSITTISDVISASGAADFDQQGTTSSITIRASNNPHGVIQFQQSSLTARSQDGMSVQFTIIREFGTFGKSTFTSEPPIDLSAYYDRCLLFLSFLFFRYNSSGVHTQSWQSNCLDLWPIPSYSRC